MDQIEQIKDKVDIVSLISEYVTLKKAGRNLKANCPFHNEKSPSFVVSPDRQIWHCFGCGEGGDVFEFVKKIENVDFGEALGILADRVGVKLVQVHHDSVQGELRDKIFQINHLVSEYYHYILLNHPTGKEALEYILNRNVSKKSLELFKIGYAPNSWDSVFKFLSKKGFSPKEMETAGVVVKNQYKESYYDRFRGRLIFTLKDHRGNVVGFAGRKITTKKDDKDAKYINTSETPVYIKGNILYGLDLTKDAIRKENKVIIVEGEIDAISSYQSGVTNVVAIKGSALTEGQLKLLKRYTDTLLISLDSDMAGDMAARRGIELAEKMGFSLKVVILTIGKDPDECIKNGISFWKESVKKAVPIYDFYINKALNKYDPNEAEGKKKIVEEVLPAIGKIENIIVKDHYIKLLADRIGVTPEIIQKELLFLQRALKLSSTTTNNVGAIQKPNKNRSEILEEHMLSLLLQDVAPEKYQKELSSLIEYFSNSINKKIADNLIEFLATKKWDIKKFVTGQQPEIISIIDRLFLEDIKTQNESEKEQDFISTFKEIKLHGLKRKMNEISEKMKNTENVEELNRLNSQFSEITWMIKQIER